jgi:hypothetical protein
MKNSKLLLTSALVGSVAMGAVANAETKISGGATYTYSAITGTTAAGNTQGAGKEVQLDISNSATLENGIGFSAGFSLEQDGSQSSFDGSEGNFMKFSSGNTSIMYNIDKAANLSRSATPRASTSINTMLVGITSASTKSQYDYSPGAQAQQSAWNLELAQKFDGGNAYIVFTPRQSDAGGDNDNIDASQSGSAMDVIVQGNMGVDGLTVLAAYSTAEAPSSTQDDQKVTMLGLAYNFGSVAAGVTRSTIDQTNATDNTQTEYGVTYAVADNLTVGLLRAVTDDSAAGVDDETITAVQVGYNLGAVSVEAYGLEVDNFQGTSTAAKQTKFGLRLGTKF